MWNLFKKKNKQSVNQRPIPITQGSKVEIPWLVTFDRKHKDFPYYPGPLGIFEAPVNGQYTMNRSPNEFVFVGRRDHDLIIAGYRDLEEYLCRWRSPDNYWFYMRIYAIRGKPIKFARLSLEKEIESHPPVLETVRVMNYEKFCIQRFYSFFNEVEDIHFPFDATEERALWIDTASGSKVWARLCFLGGYIEWRVNRPNEY